MIIRKSIKIEITISIICLVFCMQISELPARNGSNPFIENSTVTVSDSRISQIQILALDESDAEARDKILYTKSMNCTSWVDFLKLGSMASTPKYSDAIYLQGINKSNGIAQAIYMSQKVINDQNREEAIILSTSFAVSSFDYIILARLEKEPAKSKIAYMGLSKCRTLEEVMYLGSIVTDPGIRDEFAKKAMQLAKSKSDLDMVSRLASSSSLKSLILQKKDSLSSDSSAYRNRKIKMAEINAKFGVNIHDDTETGEIWTYEQLLWISETLETLPQDFINKTSEILPAVFESPTLLGTTSRKRSIDSTTNQTVSSPPVIRMYAMGRRIKEEFKGALVHEMAHAFQFQTEGIENAWAKMFWPKLPDIQNSHHSERPKTSSVSEYGNASPREDFSESARMFWENPEKMKTMYPDRYKFLRERVFGTEF
ncbi:MAG: hypothetical protein HQM10_22085 [Candidatus Riflebacteria bacterium]|nr:hypothetical protein [Candidatus Riflebacteria bacterium]